MRKRERKIFFLRKTRRENPPNRANPPYRASNQGPRGGAAGVSENRGEAAAARRCRRRTRAGQSPFRLMAGNTHRRSRCPDLGEALVGRGGGSAWRGPATGRRGGSALRAGRGGEAAILEKGERKGSRGLRSVPRGGLRAARCWVSLCRLQGETPEI